MNSSKTQSKYWDTLHKVVFKYILIYFTLFIILLFSAPYLDGLLRWFAKNILNWGANFDIQSTGSGDRSFDYVRLGFNLTLAVIIGSIWSIVGRKDKSYNNLSYWFQVVIRVFLFGAMLLYGFAKLFKGQFGDLNLELLLQPVGDMSPMGLAWTFMGHSMAYNIFLGVIEVLGGILLLNRKTVTLGSIIIIGVMANVLMLNLTYDIPVKLFSAHLLLMAMVLCSVDFKRLVAVFFKNTAVDSKNEFVPKLNTTFVKVISISKRLVAILVGLVIVIQCFVQFDLKDQLKDKSEFYGIWEAELFIKNNDTLAPMLNDNFQWRYLIVNNKNQAAIKKMNDSIDRYHFKLHKEQSKVIFTRDLDFSAHSFSYNLINEENLRLQGTLAGDSINVVFKRKLETNFRLINRGFHWVNETTYNY